MKTDLHNSLAAHWRKRYVLLAVVWSVLVIGSLAWNVHNEKQSTLRTATAAARANISKDVSFRKWAASHGGVYVAPTEHTPPNPYLNVPDRDVVTTSGKALTLMNPAYMLRQMQADFPSDFGTISHITSLKPLNPKNIADAWQFKALLSFEQGAKELLEIQQIDGQPYLRMMLPFIVDSSCLKCHAHQGYKLGDVRGGISSDISLDSFLAHEREHVSGMALSHGAIWLVGLAGLGISHRRDRRHADERERAANRLRRNEHSLSEAQRIAHLGSWDFDIEKNTLAWSDEIYRIFEIDPEKFGASYEVFLDAIHPGDRMLVDKAYNESVKNRAPYDIEHRLLMRDGRVKYVNEIGETYYGEDGKPLRSFGIVHDITWRKEAEEKIRRLNTELEQRVVARTVELVDANKELEAFSYSVSHDLRTPLRAIDGFSRMLLEDYEEKLDDEGKRLLNVVRDNTGRMAQLIEDILHFSRVGRTGMSFSEIDMEGLARAVVDEFKPLAAGRKLKIGLGKLPGVQGDRAMMHQVFENLLGNAIKFTGHKEDAHIEIGGKIEGGKAVYYIKDDGAGFDMQYAEKLFGVFQRLHSIEEFEGTGIGLAISKRIIARHGGTIWAEGEVGKGATFYFSIPVSSEKEA